MSFTNPSYKLMLPCGLLCPTGISGVDGSFHEPEDLAGSQSLAEHGGHTAEIRMEAAGDVLFPAVAAVASTVENAGLPASAAIDGNLGTRWSSAHGDPQWIYVALDSSKDINRIVLTWEAAASVHYEIQVSNDATSWTKIYEDASRNGGVDDVAVSGSGRYVRMYSHRRTSVWGNSLWEIAVYGGAAATCSDGIQNQGETGIDCGGRAQHAAAAAARLPDQQPVHERVPQCVGYNPERWDATCREPCATNNDCGQHGYTCSQTEHICKMYH